MNQTQTLQDYFKKARSWADDNFGRLEQSRSRYQTAFILAMILNCVAIVVIGMLSHYQTIVPLIVHHYENGLTSIEPLKEKKPLNKAQIESDIVRYIENRESYDASSYRTQFELIHLLSDNAVDREYLEEQSKANSTAPIKLLGEHGKREVHIYSINFLDSILENENDLHKDHHNLAEVVFSLTDTDKTTGRTTQVQFNALIAWRYLTPPDSPEARWQNWDGFEVTRYSKTLRSMEKHYEK